MVLILFAFFFAKKTQRLQNSNEANEGKQKKTKTKLIIEFESNIWYYL